MTNSRRFLLNPLDPTRQDLIVSILELPHAPPQPWITRRPGVPTGEIRTHLFSSEVLGNVRDVEVYLPPGYKTSGGPYPFVLLFDGGAWTRLTPGPTILDNLLAAGLIPPLIAVFLDNPDDVGIRSRELPANPAFVEFLAGELVPWLGRTYAITTNPSKVIVGGSSFGGLAATYAGLRHLEIFGNVLSMSGSYWWKPGWDDPDDRDEFEWHARQFVASPRLPLRFFLCIGLLDGDRRHVDDPGSVIANRHLRDVLLAKGYSVDYVEFNGGHDFLCWQGALADGLIALARTNHHEDR